MAEFETVRALVLRDARYKEADKILTLLSAEKGKITVKARGALRKSSKIAAASQTLCFSEFTLFGNRGRWTVNEASSAEQFLGLRDDIAAFALGAYFADMLDTVCAEDVPASGALSLALNALYALSRGLYTQEHIKSVFELRLMSLEGFRPETDFCGVCGEEPEQPVFAPEEGIVCCRKCADARLGRILPLDDSTLAAMRYIIRAPAKKEFSFSMSADGERQLGRVCEDFAECQMDRRLYSLDYWKKVK